MEKADGPAARLYGTTLTGQVIRDMMAVSAESGKFA